MGVCETDNLLELATWVWQPGEALPWRQGLGGTSLNIPGLKPRAGVRAVTEKKEERKAKNKTEVEPKQGSGLGGIAKPKAVGHRSQRKGEFQGAVWTIVSYVADRENWMASFGLK